MTFLPGKRNQLKQLLRPADFAKLGVRADYVGTDTIKISRSGKPLGQIRKTIGKYVWYSADTGQQQFYAFTPEKTLAVLAQRI